MKAPVYHFLAGDPGRGRQTRPPSPRVPYILGHPVDSDPTLVHDTHSDLLRGLVLVYQPGTLRDDVIVSIGDLADICFKKIPASPRASGVRNVLVAVGHLHTAASPTEPPRNQVQHVSISEAARQGTRYRGPRRRPVHPELEEIAVPTLRRRSMLGELQRQAGEFTVHLTFCWTARSLRRRGSNRMAKFRQPSPPLSRSSSRSNSRPSSSPKRK